jgi:hypothetical protein
MTQEAKTKYINILVPALHALHAAYPNEAIELRVHEDAPDSWQCYIEMRESGIKSQSESFHINPPDDTPPTVNWDKTFSFPYLADQMEEEPIRDLVALIAVMLKNGASIFELQQRLMGLQ